MAKFDWGSIDGYSDDMTAEQKLALLENYELPETETASTAPTDAQTAASPRTDMISKKQFDKVSSELAAAKRQLRARMTEDEQKAAEQQEAQEAMKAELAELRHGAKMNQFRAKFMSLGYDEANANEAAEALSTDDMEGFFGIAARQKTALEKTLRAQILKDTPVPPAGDENNSDLKNKQEMAQLRKWMGLD